MTSRCFLQQVRVRGDINMSSKVGMGRTTRISWRCACSMILEAKRPMLESRLATCSNVPWLVAISLSTQGSSACADQYRLKQQRL